MHQIDNLSNVTREHFGEKSRQGKAEAITRTTQLETIGTPVILTLAFGGICVFLYRALASRP